MNTPYDPRKVEEYFDFIDALNDETDRMFDQDAEEAADAHISGIGGCCMDDSTLDGVEFDDSDEFDDFSDDCIDDTDDCI